MTISKSNHVKIQVAGAGVNSWAYAINSKTYKKLRENELDGSALAVLQEEAIGSELISWGIDSYAYPFPEFIIEVNGRKNVVKRIIHTYEGMSFDEEFAGLSSAGEKEKETCIECSENDRVFLGEQIKNKVDIEQIKGCVFEFQTLLPKEKKTQLLALLTNKKNFCFRLHAQVESTCRL